MALLADRTSVIDMRFVRPRVARGDFYLMKSPISGRNMYVYPRMMGEKRFAVDERMGDLPTSEFQSFFTAASDVRTEAINEAVETARQIQQVSSEFPRSNLNVPSVPAPAGSVSPRQGQDLMFFGLLAIGALGVGYFLLKRRD
jgi:formylmethanofuran:tetrahydromethanopterin formyltransferase